MHCHLFYSYLRRCTKFFCLVCYVQRKKPQQRHLQPKPKQVLKQVILRHGFTRKYIQPILISFSLALNTKYKKKHNYVLKCNIVD